MHMANLGTSLQTLLLCELVSCIQYHSWTVMFISSLLWNQWLPRHCLEAQQRVIQWGNVRTVEWNVQKLSLKHLQLLLGLVGTVWGCIVVLRDHTLWHVQVLCELPHIVVTACCSGHVHWSLCSKWMAPYAAQITNAPAFPADRQTLTEFFDCWRNCMFPLPFSLFHLRCEIVHPCLLTCY